MEKTITFKEWLKHILCQDDLTMDANALAIWICTPDEEQNYRVLDLHFATIYDGMLHNMFTDLWNLYSEYIDNARVSRCKTKGTIRRW